MIYREIPVPVAMRHTAFCAWRFEVEDADPPLVEHRVPPDGTINIVVRQTLAGDVSRLLTGPSLAAKTVPALRGTRFCGLRLRPEAALAVVRCTPEVGGSIDLPPESSLAGVCTDLTALLIQGETNWASTTRLTEGVRTDNRVARAVDWLVATGGAVEVADLAQRVALSDRQFRRRFRAVTGIAPKQYSDVQRLRRALILSLRDPQWAGVAQESGFADQPHLAREVCRRFGAPPRRVAGWLGRIRHELLAPDDGRFLQEADREAR